MKTILAVIGGALALFLTIAMFGGAGWTHPPMANKQTGFRGTGMDLIRTRAGTRRCRRPTSRRPRPTRLRQGATRLRRSTRMCKFWEISRLSSSTA